MVGGECMSGAARNTSHIVIPHAREYMRRQEVLDYVDEMMNCEDISFNAVAQNVTRLPPLHVTVRKGGPLARQKLRGVKKADGLSGARSYWGERMACVQWLSKHVVSQWQQTRNRHTCSG